MANETQVRTGRCETHGTVEGSREIPRPTFPYLVYAVRRWLATRQPFRCPECGATVETT